MIAELVRSTGARRVLEIGTGTGTSGVAIAAALPADGTLITLERDAGRAQEARRAFAAADRTRNVSVVIGDAVRYLHKIAGPFDIIFYDGDLAQLPALRPRLNQLLAASGTLVIANRDDAGGLQYESHRHDD